jgi:hypothetical protein
MSNQPQQISDADREWRESAQRFIQELYPQERLNAEAAVTARRFLNNLLGQELTDAQWDQCRLWLRNALIRELGLPLSLDQDTTSKTPRPAELLEP